MGSDEQLDVEDLVGGEDLDFLREMATERGISPGEMAKEGIQEIIAKRTKPKTMPGKVQPFRR
ncbi:hypothetical protein SAMN04244572_04361 [Azotobacter beijerinckii]|uniref:Uncharacterized protein n=1 Tax=Azotobacter beijerinckii TaxID=170623 RepID=A0A1H6ZIE3_9GAMM|nr:hypothetical protein [Azotobacter beijerinckii]SEJ53058.1 hypothetical protein SAMN04244572_04361 [Azotobacter beijerinckii]